MSATKFRVLLTDRAWPDTRVEQSILAEVDAELVEAVEKDEATLCHLAANVDAIAVNWAPVTPAVVRAASRCRVICRTGIGLDNISVTTATELKIPVTNVPDYCVGEVADHAMALLLALARNVAFFHRRTKRGEYQLQAGPPMPRLAGKRLGLIGLGRIGQTVAGMGRALGLNVAAYTASGNNHGLDIPMLSLDELLATSDFISLHLPLSTATYHLLGLPQFKKMKPTAYLVNTSRGGLIDHQALWSALQQNEIAGAGLDVFEPEPPDLSHPLYQDERVIVTPHAAFVSRESLIELRSRVARQIVAVFKGERPENVVNSQVYE